MQHWRKSAPTREQGNAAPGAFQPRCRRAGYGAAAQDSPRGDYGRPAAMPKFMPAGFPNHAHLCAAKGAPAVTRRVAPSRHAASLPAATTAVSGRRGRSREMCPVSIPPVPVCAAVSCKAPRERPAPRRASPAPFPDVVSSASPASRRFPPRATPRRFRVQRPSRSGRRQEGQQLNRLQLSNPSSGTQYDIHTS